MKLKNIIFIVVAFLCMACESDNYEVNKLQKTGLYCITNTSGSEPIKWELYYELDSFIAYTSNSIIEEDYKVTELLDYSYDGSKVFDVVVKDKDDITTRYSINAPSYNETTQLATGTMSVTKQGERTIQYDITVSDATGNTDLFN